MQLIERKEHLYINLLSKVHENEKIHFVFRRVADTMPI